MLYLMQTVTGTCRSCDECFTRPRAGGHDLALFCSKRCAARWNNQHRVRKLIQRPWETCPQCGGKRSGNRGRGICRSCQTANRLAALQSLTIGELRARYGTAAFHAKLRGLSRSAYRGPLACKQCGYDRHVDVCHLRPVASFPPSATIADVNAETNLIALCPTHHWELDAGVIRYC